MLKFAKGKNLKCFFRFSPSYLLIIFDQLAKFEATCCNSFWDILITSFQCQNLQKSITQNKFNNFFLNFHQVIYSLPSISWPSLKLIAVTSLGMSVTTQGGSGRQFVTGPWRLLTCAGRQVTGFRWQIWGFGRQWKGATHTDVAENDNIVCLAILYNSRHINVCKFDIGST